MGEQMSMILLLPPSEDFSSNYWPLVGTKEPGLTLPLQIFELGKYCYHCVSVCLCACCCFLYTLS